MINLTPRDRLITLALLFNVPVLSDLCLALLWPDSDSGRENMTRRLWQLCEERLLRRHVALAQVAADVTVFYNWAPDMPDPVFGSLAWKLSKSWKALEPRSIAFYTASDSAAKHFGRSIRNPLKSASSLSHNIGLGQVFLKFAIYHPLLASAWVAEEIIAETRGHGEKVVDSCIVDSTATPALAIEFAGASYAASNGERLKEIHLDCKARKLPYEVWTVFDGGVQ
jgi:hypothetical protein